MSAARRVLAAAFAAWALAIPAARGDDAPAPAPLAPEYEVTVSDGARLRKLFRENAWMKNVQASNLFRGAMVRMGPVLYAAGPRDSWKGRLVDFLAERLLDGRPLRLAYFHAPDLVSPFGVCLPALSPAEREAAALVVRALRSGEDVATRIALDVGRVEDVAVTPIALQLQRFAVVETPTCLAISRDPRVAAVLSRRCAPDPGPAAAVLDVDPRVFFASWSAVVERLLGVGQRLRLTFDWDARRARFTPAGGELTLTAEHRIGSGPAEAALLNAVPADALFFATVFLPDPGPLSISSMESYFQAAPGRDRRAVPISLVYLGMRSGERGVPEALSVLLVPQPRGDDRALADLDALFNQSARYEVHASRACPGFVALSPSRAALARVAEVCAGRQPSLRQMSPKLLSVFTRQPLSSGVLWNAGAFFKSAVAWGWERETPPRAQGDSNAEAETGRPRAKGPPPPELAQAMQLLGELPVYAFAGRVRGNAVVLAGAEP